MSLAWVATALSAIGADASLLSRVPEAADVVIEVSLRELLTSSMREGVARALRRSALSWRTLGHQMRLGVGLDDLTLFGSFGNRKSAGYFTSLVKSARRPVADSVLGRAVTVGPFRAVGAGNSIRLARRASVKRGSWASAGFRQRILTVLAQVDKRFPVAIYYVPDKKVADRDFPGANLQAVVIAARVAGDAVSVRLVAHTPRGGADAMRRHLDTVIRLGKIALWIARIASRDEKKGLLNIAATAIDGFQFEAKGDWLIGEIPAGSLPRASEVGALIVRALERHFGRGR